MSAETFERVADAIERGNKVLEGSECMVRIDLPHLKVEIVSRQSQVAGGHFGQLLRHLPDLLLKSPELLMGVLIPLAHLLSGAAHSRKLAEVLDGLGELLALWRGKQRAIRTALATFPQQADLLREGGAALAAYREFLSNLVRWLENSHAGPRLLQTPNRA